MLLYPRRRLSPARRPTGEATQDNATVTDPCRVALQALVNTQAEIPFRICVGGPGLGP